MSSNLTYWELDFEFDEYSEIQNVWVFSYGRRRKLSGHDIQRFDELF